MLSETVLLYMALGVAPQFALAQEAQAGSAGKNVCVELARVNGRTSPEAEEVETALSVYRRGGASAAEDECAGLVYSIRAASRAVSGNMAEAELDAERSLAILDKSHAADDRVLLRPLHTLAVARFEQRKTAQARQAYRRMQLIPTELPEDRKLLHGMAATLLGAAGNFKEAASEGRAALSALNEEGRGSSAECASILIGLASIYIKDHQFDQAGQALDRAMAIVNTATDTVALDRVALLYMRGVLHARQRRWLDAEPDMREALSIATREKVADPQVFAWLLPNYAIVLRKIHRRGEARSVEARVAAFRNHPEANVVVDVTDLSAESKHRKK
jgi:tetratricopeptide (TPR) repeat protein